MTTLEREGVGVATIVEKMVELETKVRWFIHVERRPRKTIRGIIK